MSTSPVRVVCFTEPSFGENAYVVSPAGGEQPRPAWVIDPGLGRQTTQIADYLEREQLRVERILLTHGHADHIAGVDRIAGICPQAGLWISAEDRPMLDDPQLNLSAPFGFHVVVHTPPAGDLPPGATLLLGDIPWQVLDTSGHSPGGRSFYCPSGGLVITGDALFAGSIGRTDFPGSDHDRLIDNIRRHLLTLPEETVVYSGHGPATTIAEERKFNPFLADA